MGVHGARVWVKPPGKDYVIFYAFRGGNLAQFFKSDRNLGTNE